MAADGPDASRTPSRSPKPSASPQAPGSNDADVTVESNPDTEVKTLTVQGTYTGATYGPGNLPGTQLIARLASLKIGKSLLRLSLPRFQSIDGVASGISDMQFFYLFQREVRVGRAFAGVFAQFPTATDPHFGTGKWLIGPAGAYIFLFNPKREIAGVLLQSGFSAAGAANRPNQSVLTVLPFADSPKNTIRLTFTLIAPSRRGATDARP